MQKDLDFYFGYRVSVEVRKMPVWYLRANNEIVKTFETKTADRTIDDDMLADGKIIYTNVDIRDIIGWMSKTVRHRYDSDPDAIYSPVFIDKTNVEYEIDYTLNGRNETIYGMKSMDKINKQLNKIGLYLEKGEMQMKVVVIRDKKENP